VQVAGDMLFHDEIGFHRATQNTLIKNVLVTGAVKFVNEDCIHGSILSGLGLMSRDFRKLFSGEGFC